MIIRAHILVCGGTGCVASKSTEIMAQFEKHALVNGIEKEIKVVKTGCFGLCEKGPIVVIYPEGATYSKVSPEDVKEIVEEHLVKGRIVKRLLLGDAEAQDVARSLDNVGFFSRQLRIALRNCGVINPEVIDEYIARDGYAALAKVLTKMSPQEVIAEMKKSGLRGRGGAGFPTGMKWEFAAVQKSDVKYVCCNADEGDPGAFMDRSVLEGDPHSVIEAMAIAAYAIGSNQGYVYVRAEYPIAVQRLRIAMDQAREYGLLGKNILETGFDFDLEIRLGAGAFVCGEETALMTSIEGKRGEPRPTAAVPGRQGSLGQADHSEQRGDLCEHPRHLQQRRGMVLFHRHREVQGYEGFRRRRKNQQYRTCGDPDGDTRFARSSTTSAAASRTARNSRPCRPADLPADASRWSTSTSRSNTSPSSPSGP